MEARFTWQAIYQHRLGEVAKQRAVLNDPDSIQEGKEHGLFRHYRSRVMRGGEVMPMGPTCRVCGRLMWKKVSEKKEPRGNTIVYECTNDGCSNYVKSGYRLREKVFEPK